MGQAKAKLEHELPVRQIVSDLSACWCDREADVLKILAGLVLDGKLALYAKIRIPVPGLYVKVTDQATRLQMDSATPATTTRNLLIDAAIVETRLRKAARDGWEAATPISHGEHVVEFDSLLARKESLIIALESERLSIPLHWKGIHDAGDHPMTRAAIKKTFTAVSDSTWRNLFDRDNGIRACRLSKTDGRKVLYSRTQIERWLIRNAHYTQPDIDELRAPAVKRGAQQTTPSLQSLPRRTHKSR